MFQVNEDLWHDVDIYTILDIIQGLCLGAGFLQVYSFLTRILSYAVCGLSSSKYTASQNAPPLLYFE